MYNNNKIIKTKQGKEEKQPPWPHQLKEKKFSLPGPALISNKLSPRGLCNSAIGC